MWFHLLLLLLIEFHLLFWFLVFNNTKLGFSTWVFHSHSFCLRLRERESFLGFQFLMLFTLSFTVSPIFENCTAVESFFGLQSHTLFTFSLRVSPIFENHTAIKSFLGFQSLTLFTLALKVSPPSENRTAVEKSCIAAEDVKNIKLCEG